jgi:hypothetical protein
MLVKSFKKYADTLAVEVFAVIVGLWAIPGGKTAALLLAGMALRFALLVCIRHVVSSAGSGSGEGGHGPATAKSTEPRSLLREE